MTIDELKNKIDEFAVKKKRRPSVIILHPSTLRDLVDEDQKKNKIIDLDNLYIIDIPYFRTHDLNIGEVEIY